MEYAMIKITTVDDEDCTPSSWWIEIGVNGRYRSDNSL